MTAQYTQDAIEAPHTQRELEQATETGILGSGDLVSREAALGGIERISARFSGEPEPYSYTEGYLNGLAAAKISIRALPAAPVLQDLEQFDPADDEAVAWVIGNLSAIRRDNGNMDYTLKAVVRAFQAGKAAAPAVKVKPYRNIRALWKQHGGSIHGPRVETWTIPEEKIFAFLAALEGGE